MKAVFGAFSITLLRESCHDLDDLEQQLRQIYGFGPNWVYSYNEGGLDLHGPEPRATVSVRFSLPTPVDGVEV